MKKLLGIVVLGLLWCNVSFADQNWRIQLFAEWLNQNGHHQYLNLNGKTNLKIRLNKKKKKP